LDLLYLVRLECRNFRFGIEVGSGESDGLESTAPVTHLEEGLSPKALAASPAPPLILDVGGGVHQHAVQIEEYGAALEAFHGG
jgi:hypothetical protein